MRLLERLNKFPPFLCRLVARKNHGEELLSERDIAKRSGLARDYVRRLSRLTAWDQVPTKTVQRFSDACGVNLLAPWRHVHWLRRRKTAWLKKKPYVARLLKLKAAQK